MGSMGGLGTVFSEMMRSMGGLETVHSHDGAHGRTGDSVQSHYGVHGRTGDSVQSPVERESAPELDSAIGQQLSEVVLRAPVTVLTPSLAQ